MAFGAADGAWPGLGDSQGGTAVGGKECFKQAVVPRDLERTLKRMLSAASLEISQVSSTFSPQPCFGTEKVAQIYIFGKNCLQAFVAGYAEYICFAHSFV